jgi:hypothetical protein
MKNPQTSADSSLGAGNAFAPHANGTSATKPTELVRRAKAVVTALPSRVDAQLKANPYATLAVACAVGVGLGVVLSSRILRSALASAATFAAVELTRSFLRQNIAQMEATAAG